MIKIRTFTFNPFSENTYVLHDSESAEAVIIDPGCYTKEEQKELDDYISSQNLKVVKLLNTHCHIDHVLGNSWVKDKYKTALYIHREDEQVLRAVESYASVYGFPQYQPTQPDHFLKEGEVVTFGNASLEVLFVPGHAPGHIAFYSKEQDFCINGDCLFQSSIGRTDLPGGDFDTLINSIRTRLFTLPDQTVIYCGHGPETSIGHEKKFNPFCREKI